MRKIFLDTGGVLATVNKRDALHKKAVELNEKLESEQVQFITTDYVLVEICNALSKHKSLALKTLENFQTSEDIRIIKITDDVFDQAIAMYTKYSDKDWGLTDITSFLVMQQEKTREAFTGDHHFQQFGFKALLR